MAVLVISERVSALGLLGAVVAGVARVLHVPALHVLHHVMLLEAAEKCIHNTALLINYVFEL